MITKARFSEAIRSRIAERVLNELAGMAHLLSESVAYAVYEGQGPDAVKQNVAEFEAAAKSVIDQWTDEIGRGDRDEVAKLAGPENLNDGRVRWLAFNTVHQLLKTRKEEGRLQTMTTGQFTKSSDVLAAATAEATKLMKAHPEKYPNVVAARAQVWRDRPDLAEAMQTLPADTPTAPEKPVQKGQSAIDRATAEARQLMKMHPDRFPSEVAARAYVWKTDPDLAAAYQSEAYA